MTTIEKVAVVTGGSQGIGAGLVAAFRSRNYNVVTTSRSIKEGNDSGVVTFAGDVADPATAERVFKEALDRFGRVDTLVNNAGIFMAKPFTAYSVEDYERYVATNITGFFYMTQRAVETMMKQGAGHIVTITTSLAEQPMTSVPSVLASLTKGALNAATKSLAIECARSGVRVNAVSPGIIKTPMHPAEAHPALASLHPGADGRYIRYRRLGDVSRLCKLCNRGDIARGWRPDGRPSRDLDQGHAAAPE